MVETVKYPRLQMTKGEYSAANVYSLDPSQELILKKIWGHLLRFWDYPLDMTAVNKDSETIDADEKKKTKKKKKGLFGGLYGSGSSKKTHTSSADETAAATAATVTVESPSIHPSLVSLDPQSTKDIYWKMLRTDLPDNLLLRFVRARKWDADKSMEMIAHTLDWRCNKSKVDDIILAGEAYAYQRDLKGLIKNLELRKAVINGCDKQGRPIVVVRPRLHYSDDQTEEELERYCLLIIEQTRLFLKDPVEAATILFDLSDFTMSNMDYTPVKFLISCFEAHYPECLGHLIIHKASWIFPPIWNIIKKWLDPVVASKVVFTKSFKDLTKFIAPDNVPKYLGGEDETDLDYFPPVDGSQDTRLNDVESKAKFLEERHRLIENFTSITIEWIQAENPELSAKLLKQKIDIGLQLSRNYANVDPYIRSRCNYDINGTLVL